MGNRSLESRCTPAVGGEWTAVGAQAAVRTARGTVIRKTHKREEREERREPERDSRDGEQDKPLTRGRTYTARATKCFFSPTTETLHSGTTRPKQPASC